jgi:hypothetical protein
MMESAQIDYSMLKNQTKLGKIINTYLDGNIEKKKRKHEYGELIVVNVLLIWGIMIRSG